MKNWEKALNVFLKKYKNKDYFEGALLCGSYSTGNQNEFSDIDIHIVISDKMDWRERGNIRIENFLIEYFINPIRQIRQEFKGDIIRGRHSCANMFAYGKIICDKNGILKHLQDEACRFLKKEMPKYKPSDYAFDCYGVWDLMDELKSLKKDKKSIGLIYYKLLENLQNLYFKSKRIPKITPAKIEKILTDLNFAKRYHIQKMPDKKFTQLFVAALKDMEVSKIQKLYDFVLQEVGGFDITKFKLKSKIDYK